MNRNLLSRPIWLVIGRLLTMLQFRILAALLGMTRDDCLEQFGGDDWVLVECLSWLNGCAALFAAAGIVLVVVMHFAGAF